MENIPTRDHIASGELFEDHARHRTHVRSVDLGEVARAQTPSVLPRFAHGVETARRARRDPETPVRDD